MVFLQNSWLKFMCSLVRCLITFSWLNWRTLWTSLSQDTKKKRSQHETLFAIRITGYKPRTNNDLPSSILPITMIGSVNHNFTDYINSLWQCLAWLVDTLLHGMSPLKETTVLTWFVFSIRSPPHFQKIMV